MTENQTAYTQASFEELFKEVLRLQEVNENLVQQREMLQRELFKNVKKD